jgi:hypothetical protein
MVSTLIALTLIPEHVLAKRVPTGHPSLFVTLYAGTDARFDFVIVEDANTLEELKADIDQRLYGIFDMTVLPEIRREFAQRASIYSDSYVESIRAYLDVSQSTLDILVEKIPDDYGCSEESCAHRKVSVNLPAELRPSHFNNIGFSIAVYEQMDSGGAYDQLVERMAMKALTEAKFLFSEGANVLEANREALIEGGTIEHILLRQYEDISRISVLFMPSELGVASSAEEPIDVVITSNSYYQRFWSSSSQQQLQEEPGPEMLQECEERGMEAEDCSESAIIQSIRPEPALEKDEIEQQNGVIESSLALIGIGAVAAGLTAVIAIKKLK